MIYTQLCNFMLFLFNCLHTKLFNQPFDIMVKVFVNDSGDRRSIPGRVIPKTQKIVFDASLLNTLHYKICGKWSTAGKDIVPSLYFGVVALDERAFGLP